MTDKRTIDQMLAEIEQFTERRRQRAAVPATAEQSEEASTATAVERPKPTAAPETVQQVHGYQYSGTAIPRQSAEPPPYPQSSAHPAPKRPKGRLLTGIFLLALFGFIGYQVWSSFFRYSAYGIVDSRRLNIAAPTDGVVQSVHVRVGDKLRQGQLLLTLNNLELQHQLERTRDELRIEQARLSAESAKLHWQMRIQQLENDEAVADYFEAWARLENELADQLGLEQRYERAKKLHDRRVMTSDQYEELLYERKGAEEKIKRRHDALTAWRTRAKKASAKIGVSTDQIDPILAKIDSLQAELIRIRESLLQCNVRSPVNGTLLSWEVHPGEFAKQGETLLSVSEEQSEYVRLYVPQEQRANYQPEDQIAVEIRPHPGTIACVVERLADDYRQPPETIRKHYSPNELLLMLELRPVQTPLNTIGIRPGAQVRLPNSLFARNRVREMN